MSERQYTRRDLDLAIQRAQLHQDLETAALALLRAESRCKHEHCRGADLATVAGRVERISALLGELRELLLLGVTEGL